MLASLNRRQPVNHWGRVSPSSRPPSPGATAGEQTPSRNPGTRAARAAGAGGRWPDPRPPEEEGWAAPVRPWGEAAESQGLICPAEGVHSTPGHSQGSWRERGARPAAVRMRRSLRLNDTRSRETPLSTEGEGRGTSDTDTGRREPRERREVGAACQPQPENKQDFPNEGRAGKKGTGGQGDGRAKQGGMEMPGWCSGTATGPGSRKLPEEMGRISSQSTFNSVPRSLNVTLRPRAPTGLGAGEKRGAMY